jgi:hypothetical protein
MTALLLVHRDEPILCGESSASGVAAALYFSAVGAGSVSLLLPNAGLSWFVTVGPICKETY